MIEIIEKLDAVIGTLNNIEVRRKQNLMSLAGCMSVLEELSTELKQREADKYARKEGDA